MIYITIKIIKAENMYIYTLNVEFDNINIIIFINIY